MICNQFFPIYNCCHCSSDACEVDPGDSGQSAGCKWFYAGTLGHCSAN